METTATTKIRTILLVGILSISMLSAGFVGLGAAAPSHERIPSVNVDDRTPAQPQNPANVGPPTDPDEWAVGSSKHSDTMSAEIIVDEETLRGITVTDDVNHEGRDVSISRDALSGSIEEIPEEVTGVHEDGDRWSSDVRISGDRVVVYVPHFSTQTISFSSRVSITANPADDGASFEYEVANASSVAYSELLLEGVINNKDKNLASNNVNSNTSINFNIGGNMDPDNESIKISASNVQETELSHLDQATSSTDLDFKPFTGDGESIDGGSYYYESTFGISPSKSGKLTKISPNIHDTGGALIMEIKPVGGSYQKLVEWTPSSNGRNIVNVNNYTVSKDTDYKIHAYPVGSTSVETVFYYDTNNQDFTGSNLWDIGYTVRVKQPVNNLSVSSNKDSLDIKDLSSGEVATRDINLDKGSDTLDFTGASNQFNYNLSWTAKTISNNPSVTISSDAGSQTVDYSGYLSDGSTVDLSSEIDQSIINGNVSVSVSVSDSVSSGPVGQVGLDYAHDAHESKEIDYSGEEFSERYSFTHQWPLDRPSASITIPWASDRVVDVRSVQINGQETTEYSAADGELTVDLGSVQSGDQTNVTAVGSKVSVSGGEISVDDPTTQGEDLDSGISVQSLSEETLEIDVSDSYHVDERDRMIYVPDSSASWSGADPITRIEPGSQTVEIDPTSSSSFRLRSAGVGSSIESGDAVLRMEDAAEPRVSVSAGATEGDTLKLTYHDTVSGDYYRVVDSEGNALDTDRASSPAEFRISDTSGVFSIEQFTPEAIVSGISSGAAAVSSGDSLIPPWLALIFTLSVSILGLAYASTRTEIGSSMLGRRLIIGGGLVLGYVGAELVTGERLYRIGLDGVSGFIGSALGAGAGAGSGAISGLADIGFISLVLGIGLLVGLYAIDQRTGIDIPRAGWGIAGGLISVWIISQLGLGTGISIGGQQSLSIVLAIGIVLGLLALDQRGILSIPLPLYAGTALLAGVYVLETLAPGSVLGPLQSGLDEVGPLIWLAIIGGALLLLYVWLRSNRPEITIPGLRGGNR